MGNDFKAGDVVVCVNPAEQFAGGNALTDFRRGDVDRVISVSAHSGNVFLCFSNRGQGGWCHWRFRKIDRADEQFCQRIKSCRPLRTMEPA